MSTGNETVEREDVDGKQEQAGSQHGTENFVYFERIHR